MSYIWFSTRFEISRFFLICIYLFGLTGSTLLWNDKCPSYALKECLGWNFKMRYFIDTDEYLSCEHDGGKMAAFKGFILKVL